MRGVTDGPRVLGRDALDALLAALRRRGFTVIGPTVRSGAIQFEEIASVADLPEGWTDDQEGGTYRVRRRQDGALFGFNVGPNSWKHHLFPPTLRLWRARRGADGGLEVEADEPKAPRYAFLGVRSCDLHAIGVQDVVFTGGRHVDRDYEARRQNAFIIAVNCGQAGGTCFCVSMGTGPRADRGFDLALTELLDGGPHRFRVEVGSERGGSCWASYRPWTPRARMSRRQRAWSSTPPPRWAARWRPATSASCCWATSRTRAGRRCPTAA